MNKVKQNICPGCTKKFIVADDNKAYRPFCSRRCKMIDLGQWLGEKYVVGGEQAPKNLKTDNDEQ